MIMTIPRRRSMDSMRVLRGRVLRDANGSGTVVEANGSGTVVVADMEGLFLE
jgi:hypothetical protein